LDIDLLASQHQLQTLRMWILLNKLLLFIHSLQLLPVKDYKKNNTPGPICCKELPPILSLVAILEPAPSLLLMPKQQPVQGI